MRKLFHTKFAVVAILSLFTFALASAGTLVSGMVQGPVAHGPTMLPDGSLTVASGPFLPPDPWEGN